MNKLFTLILSLLVAAAVNADVERTVGGDLSMVPAYEQAGDQWMDADGNAIPDLITFVKEKGWNTARVRLFVDPTQDSDPSTCQDLEYTKALGKRIKEAGMKLMLDLHYSDTWADPSNQKIPASWAGLTDDELAQKLGDYTTEVLTAMKEAGAEPDLVQTGNEITYGLLWRTEDGKVPTDKTQYATAGYCTTWSSSYNEGKTQWVRTANLLNAATAAVRTTLPEAKIIIHTELGSLTANSDHFYKYLKQAGFTDYDIIGFSYYPFWHGTLSSLGSLLTTLKTDFPDKKVEIVETAWSNNGYPSDAKYTIDQLNSAWTANANGQVQFIADLVSRLKNYDNVDGLMYWAPEECGSGYTKTVWPYAFNRGMWKSSSQKNHSIIKNSNNVTTVDALASYRTGSGKGLSLKDILVNPDFETGDLTGWTKGQDWTTMWPNNISSWASKDVVQGTYTLELWNGTTNQGEVIYQSITMPKAGGYKVTCRVHTDNSGVYLFAGDSKHSIHKKIAVGESGLVELYINSQEGDFSFGIYTDQSTDSKYIYCDDFMVTDMEGAVIETIDESGEDEPEEDPTSFTDDQGLVYHLYDDNTASVENGKSVEGEIVIPSVIVVNEEDYYVTSVLANAFFQNSKMTAVTIGKNVNGIWNSAFNGCGNLSKVYFEEGSNLTTIDGWVFSGTPIDSIAIPSGVTVINEGVFSNCWSLKYVAMLGDVTEIKQFAFSKWTADDNPVSERNWCSFEKGVYIYSIEPPTISAKAFCADDIQAATLYVRKQNVENPVFTGLGFAAVAPIEGTEQVYCDIDGVRYALDSDQKSAQVNGIATGSESLTSISIPETITYNEEEYAVNSIKTWAFVGNTSLQTVKVGESINVIPEGAFAQCSALKTVKLMSEDLESIGDFAFGAWAEEGCASGCPALTSVVVYGAPEISEKAFCQDDIQQTTTLYVSAELVEDYEEYGFKAVLPLEEYAGNGDVDGDGVVDIADVNAVLTVMFSEEGYSAAADVNADGYVDIADVNAVLTIMYSK